MNETEKLLKFLKTVLTRLSFFHLLRYLFRGLIIGLGLFSVVSISALFIPIYREWLIGLIFLGVSLLCHVILAIVFRPSLKDAAAAADTIGLKERMATAYEYISETDDMTLIQRHDAVRFIDTISLKGHFHFIPEAKHLALLGCLVVTSVVPLFINAPSKVLAKEKQAVTYEKKETTEQLEKKAKELTDNFELSYEDTEELKKLLAETKKELKEAKSKTDIKKAEDRYNTKLEKQIKKKLYDEAKSQIKDALDKLKDGKMTAEDVEKLMEKIKDLQKLLDTESLNELAEKLSELLEDKELQDALQQALDNETLKDLLEEALNDGTISEEDIENALSSLSNALQQAQNLNQQYTATGHKPSNGQQTAQGQQSTQGQQGQSGQQNASGEQSSQGNGSQSGQSGEGGQGQSQSGSGSSGQSIGGGQGFGGQGAGGSGQGGGWNRGGYVGTELKIPNMTNEVVEGAEYKDENLTGKYSGSENSTYTDADEFLAVAGDSPEYEAVIAQYRDYAFEALDGSSLPDAYQEIIKNYFSEISSQKNDED